MKKVVCILMSFLLIIASVSLCFSEEKEEEEKAGTYFEGKRDGKIAGGAENAIMTGGAMGCCLGCLGYGLVPMAGTEPPYEMMKDIEHKSDDYREGFREGYKGKKKSQFVTGVTIGWLTSLAVAVIVYSSTSQEE